MFSTLFIIGVALLGFYFTVRSVLTAEHDFAKAELMLIVAMVAFIISIICTTPV